MTRHSYRVGIRTCSDYSPFGVELDGRTVSGGYRYGFNGKEKLDEISGDANEYDFGARMYDARVGRFLSRDAYASKFTYQSSYVFAGNMPIGAIDMNGDSTYLVLYGSGQLATGYTYGDLGKSNEKSALARKTAIENTKDFVKGVDEVILVYTPTEKDAVDALNVSYSSGKIKQVDIYSHGSNVGINFGGPIIPGANYATDDSQDRRTLSSYDQSRDANIEGENEMLKIDANNFGAGAVINIWACYTGGAIVGKLTKEQAQNYSPAQGMANATGATVYASYDSGMQFKTNVNGNNIYDGTMIRDKDVKSQKSNMTEYKPKNTATTSSPNKVRTGGGL